MEERNQMTWHQQEAEEVGRLLETDLQDGLKISEVTRRQQKYGPNRVSTRRGMGAFKRLLLQFHQPLVYVLLAAATLTAFLEKQVDSSVILGVVLLNAI